MKRPRYRVQHAVLARIVRQYGTPPTSDLLGLRYTHTWTPDIEFPRHLAQVDLFTRFLVYDDGAEDFYVRVWRLVGDDRHTLMGTFGPFRVQFDRDVTHADRYFRLRDVRLEGIGPYAIKLCRRSSVGWKGKRLKVLKTEYFQVETYP